MELLFIAAVTHKWQLKILSTRSVATCSGSCRVCFTGKTRGAICLELDELGEMAFLSDQYLRAVFFFAVGGVSAIAVLKIWENKESLLREIRRQFDLNEARQPEENDERFN